MTRPSVASSPPSLSSGKYSAIQNFLRRLIDSLQLVRSGFVRAEHAEVVHVFLHHVAKEVPQRWDVLDFDGSWLIDFHGVVGRIRADAGPSSARPPLA